MAEEGAASADGSVPAAASEGGQGYSLRSLLAAPKGNLVHEPADAFLLHVFWQAPSATAAAELLSGLRQCAAATHRDTPCVPTYFFRISNNDADLCPPPPRTAGEHPQLAEAHKKLRLGIPRPAVLMNMTKLGLAADLLELDPEAELPKSLRAQPVALEFTEVYLDERAFMEHAGSRDYLDGHSVVMRPALMYSVPRTVRLGTPPVSMVERILEPILREEVAPLPDGCAVWRRPPGCDGAAMLMSLDLPSANEDQSCAAAAAVASSLPSSLTDLCSTFVAFAHPLRPGTTRLLCVLPCLPPAPALEALAALRPARGEAHVTGTGVEAAVEAARAAMSQAGLGMVTVNASDCVGYVLHERAPEVHSKEHVV